MSAPPLFFRNAKWFSYNGGGALPSSFFMHVFFSLSCLFLVLFVLCSVTENTVGSNKSNSPPFFFFYIHIFSYWSKTGAEEQHRMWSPELNKVFNVNKNTPLSTPRQPTFGTCINLALKRLRFNVGMSLCEQKPPFSLFPPPLWYITRDWPLPKKIRRVNLGLWTRQTCVVASSGVY